jgi:hypothetical protein
MADDWITTKKAVELSGYNPDHLRELIRDGKIEAQKFGIVWQVSQKSLLEYLAIASKSEDKRWGPKR